MSISIKSLPNPYRGTFIANNKKRNRCTFVYLYICLLYMVSLAAEKFELLDNLQKSRK